MTGSDFVQLRYRLESMPLPLQGKVLSFAHFAMGAPYLPYACRSKICGLFIHVTVVSNFTSMQMNEIEQIQSNPAVFPKIRHVEIATTS